MPGRAQRAGDIERVRRLKSDAERECRRSQALIAEARRLLERMTEHPASPPSEVREPIRPRRNKLFYKHRWLISANMIAALRRAGVDCNIVLPAAVTAADDRPTSETVWTGPEKSSDETLH